MVKHWIPARPKATKEKERELFFSDGGTRVGTRALRVTGFGGNLLASLRQRIVKRPKPQAITAAPTPLDEAPPVAPVAVSAVSSFPPASWARQPTAPKPPRGSDDEEDSDESEDDEDVAQGGGGQDVATKPEKKKKSKSKRPSLGLNRWVPKLLNPVEKHRDKDHRKKKKHLLALPQGPPVLFTVSKPLTSSY